MSPSLQPANRLPELIVYLCSRCDQREYWGRTKLAKLLYFSDFRHYKLFGRSITNEQYICRPQGPVPQSFFKCMECLAASGSIVEVTRDVLDHTERRPAALRSADLAQFTASEISLVDRIIEQFAGLTATQLSDLSHREPGWQLADAGEVIPYETAFLSSEPMTAEERDYAFKLVVQLPT